MGVDRPPFDFELSSLHAVREIFDDAGAHFGLSPDRRSDLVLAISELATNAVQYGGGHGTLRCWIDGDRLVSEVTDSGRIAATQISAYRPARTAEGGYGLLLAIQLTDLVAIRASDAGTAVRVEVSR